MKELDFFELAMAQLLPDQIATYRNEAKARRDKDLTESMRANCCDSLDDIATAIRRPLIAREYLEAAIAKLTVALDCAKALDQ